MRKRRLAFVGLIPSQAWKLARRLERDGFEVYWIQKWKSEVEWLRGRGIEPARILDASAAGPLNVPEDVARLVDVEREEYPTINEIILMDRHLRRIDPEDARQYIRFLVQVLTPFMGENQLDLVSTRRDTALQILAMSVAASCGIRAVIPTRLRLPRHRFGFTDSHEERELLWLRPLEKHDYEAASSFLATFRAAKVQPLYIPALASGKAIVRELPRHLRTLWRVVRDGWYDDDNYYSRWNARELVATYLRKKRNLIGQTVADVTEGFSADRRILLFAMQTQPESSVDVLGSFHSDQFTLITQIVRAMPASHQLYVKLHPASCDSFSPSYLKQLAALPGVKVLDRHIGSREALERSDIVFTISSTIAFEAGLLAKSAIIFSNTFFKGLPTVHQCTEPTKLPKLVRKLLGKTSDPDVDDHIISFLAELFARSYDGEVNRFGTRLSEYEGDKLTEDELSTLVSAYTDVAAAFERAGTA